MKRNSPILALLATLIPLAASAQPNKTRQLIAEHLFKTGKSEEKTITLETPEHIRIPATLDIVEGSGRNARAILQFHATDSLKTICTYAGPRGRYFVRIRYVIEKLLTAAAGINPWKEALANPNLSLVRQTCSGPAAKSDRAEAKSVSLRILADEHHIFTSKTVRVQARLEVLPTKVTLPATETAPTPNPQKPITERSGPRTGLHR